MKAVSKAAIWDLGFGIPWSLELGIWSFSVATMARFTYIALDARGQESTGLVEASTTNEAIGELRRAGYFPTHVYEEGAVAAAQPKAVRQKKTKEPRPERKAGGVNIVLFQRKTVKPK